MPNFEGKKNQSTKTPWKKWWTRQIRLTKTKQNYWIASNKYPNYLPPWQSWGKNIKGWAQIRLTKRNFFKIWKHISRSNLKIGKKFQIPQNSFKASLSWAHRTCTKQLRPYENQNPNTFNKWSGGKLHIPQCARYAPLERKMSNWLDKTWVMWKQKRQSIDSKIAPIQTQPSSTLQRKLTPTSTRRPWASSRYSTSGVSKTKMIGLPNQKSCIGWFVDISRVIWE